MAEMNDDEDPELTRILSSLADSADSVDRGDGFFKSKREFDLLANHFEQKEQAEMDAALNRMGDADVKALIEIDRLENLRDTDFNAYSREGGSDKLLALLTAGEEDQSP